jgi:RNA polymerase sigma-70 factor (ECF subfamily)
MRQTTATAQVSYCASPNTPETFNWLYQKYWKPLLHQSYFYLKDHSLSEEIVQQLFIDIYQKNIRIQETTNIDSYLRKAIRNRAYNCLLSNKRYRNHLKKLLIKNAGNTDNSTYNQVAVKDTKKQIHFYLGQLNESCRTVFLLNREEQMTIREIAIKLQRPEDTVTKQLGKAVRHLYKCIVLDAAAAKAN